MTIGELVDMRMRAQGIDSIPGIPNSIMSKLVKNEYWPNSIPIILFRDMLLILSISFEEASDSIYESLESLPSSSTKWDTRPELWECKEAVDKYIKRLKNLLNKTY